MFNMYDWKEYNSNGIKNIQQQEPFISFKLHGVEVFSIKASGLFYNQTQFPHDTYQQAAQRTFDAMRQSLSSDHTIYVQLTAYKEHPARHFNVTKDGIDHNYSTDTWHWWMIQNLEEIIKSYATC